MPVIQEYSHLGDMPLQEYMKKNRRRLRKLGYLELACYHVQACYWKLYDQCYPSESPFGANNIKIFCLNNGGQYLNVDRKLFVRSSPIFAEMVRETKKGKYFSIPVDYKVLRWCMRMVHSPSGTFRPYSIRMIDQMFHVAHEYQIQAVIDELMPILVEEDLLYLTWNYKHREATRQIYDKHDFAKIGRIVHSEKFRNKKYTVPVLDFAALFDLKVKEDQQQLLVNRNRSSSASCGRCGNCPFCALADLPSPSP